MRNPNIRTQTHSNAPSRQGELADGYNQMGHNQGQRLSQSMINLENSYKMAQQGQGNYNRNFREKNYNRTGQSSPNNSHELMKRQMNPNLNHANVLGTKRSSNTWEQENLINQSSQNLSILSPENEVSKKMKY